MKIHYLFVLIAASLWGCIGFFTKNLEKLGFGDMQLVFFRALFAGIALILWLLIKDKSKLKVRLKDLWMFALASVVSVIMMNFFYFTAISRTTMGMAAILLYTAPIFVVLMSAALFREPLTGKKWFSLFLAFSGCVLVSGVLKSSGKPDAVGILAGLGSGITYALYSIFSKWICSKGYSPITFTTYTIFISAIISFPLADPANITSGVSMTAGTVIFLVAFSIVSNLIPYLFYNTALQKLEAGRASVIATIEPAVATVVGFAAFGQTPELFSVAGIILVMSAAMILALDNGKKVSKKS